MLTMRQIAASQGVTPRTIKMLRGLGCLPPPVGLTSAARYTAGHVRILAAYRRLVRVGERTPSGMVGRMPLAEFCARVQDGEIA